MNVNLKNEPTGEVFKILIQNIKNLVNKRRLSVYLKEIQQSNT